MIEWVGYMAAFLTTVCYLPQALHVIRSKQTAGISLLGYLTLFAGITCWVIYGLLIGNWPIILCNGITLPLVVTILVMKVRLG